MNQAVALADTTSRRLLLVEDDQRTARRLASMLEEDGFVVEVLRDGREALERLAQEPAPDGIITDLIMPRAGGIAVLGEARRRWKDIPVLFVTGHPELLAAAPVPFMPEPIVFTKPLSYADFSEKLTQLFPR